MTDRIEQRSPTSFRRKNVHEQVVDELGARIVQGSFPGDGALPTEPVLATELGISRNALREAIKVLAGKGMVEVRPKTGMRIRPRNQWNLLDRDVLAWFSTTGTRLSHARDLVEFRLCIEPRASYLAALRATDEEIEAIRAAYRALEACVGHPARVPAADVAFHRSIYDASHNIVFHHLGSLVAPLMQIQVTLTTAPPGTFERGLPLHFEVTEAIARHEPEHAEEVSRRLVESPYQNLSRQLDEKKA